MLKQTAESQDRKAVFFPGNDKSPVELGSFKEMVFQRNPKNKISFKYDWSFTPALNFKDPNGENTYEGEQLGFEAEISLDATNQQTLSVEKFKYTFGTTLSVEMQKVPEKKLEYKVDAYGYNLVKKIQRQWPIKAP